MSLRHEHGPLARLRLGRPEDVAATGPPDERLGHREPSGVEIESDRPGGPATSDQRRPSDGTDPDHRPVLLGHVGGDAGDVLGGQVEATSALDRGQVDVAARVPGQPVVAHGVAEHGSHDLVVPLDRPGGVLGPPGVDQPLDVPGPDPLDPELADRRQHVEAEGELLPGRGGLPLVRVGGGPLLGQLGHLEAAGPRVDPHAPADVGLDGGEEGPGVALVGEARRCDVAAAVVPVAGLVEPAPLAHAPERAIDGTGYTPCNERALPGTTVLRPTES